MIGFLQPLALFAVSAAAIPMLLHLLGRRLPPTVVFPAVLYLTATEREHSRRLRLRNLLLLLLRTAFIVFLVLAAARPVLRFGSGGSHAPSALALVIDNSLSSGAVVEGRVSLDTMIELARGVLAQANSGDMVWLVLSDGIPRRQTRAEAIQTLESLTPTSVRMDIGAAVRAASRAVTSASLPGAGVVVLSDLQATALSRGEPVSTRVLAWAPPALEENRWLDSVFAEPAIWTGETNPGIVVSLGGSGSAGQVRLRVADRDIARAVASPGERVVLWGTGAVVPLQSGWSIATVEVDPDELRADDSRVLALFHAEPAAVAVQPGAGGFVEEALAVLREGGRVSDGDQIVVGDFPAANASIVFPPADPAMVGALNRALAARGVFWQFEEVVEGEWQVAGQLGAARGTSVYRRYRLEGTGNVFGRVGGEAWLVRSGEVVIVASRLEPDWTQLPVSAAFLPFVDFLVNRIAARETWFLQAHPGEMVRLPPSVTAVLGPPGFGVSPVSADPLCPAPRQPGVYFLIGESNDTVGVLEVGPDPRESSLEPVGQSELRAVLGDETHIVDADDLLRDLFAAADRTDLSGLFLIVAALTLLAEFVVASSGGRKGEVT